MDTKRINPPSVVRKIAQRYKNGYSPIVLVCGKMRDGKTSKTFIFAQWLSWLLFKKAWDWKKNTIITMDQFTQSLASNESGIFVIDECQRIFGKKLWWSKDSILFDTLLTSQAYKHYIIFLILPRASALGTDHAYNVNYVIPIHHKTLCQPYRVDSNEWDIALKQKKLNKFAMSHFTLDLESKEIQSVFKDELTQLSEFKTFIEKNLKEPIMDKAREQSMIAKPEEWYEEQKKNPIKVSFDSIL